MPSGLILSPVHAAMAAGRRILGGINLGRMFRVIATWRERHRSRVDLSNLPPDLLRDIGITPDQAAAEWQKPFWR